MSFQNNQAYEQKNQLLEQAYLFKSLNFIVNLGNSFPLLILIVAVIPYFARLVEQSLTEANRGVIEASISMGANPFAIVWKALFVESRSGFVASITNITVLLISYSTIAGVVGAGGLGDFAVRNGYYRYQPDIMFATVFVILLLVCVVQVTGSRFASYLDKR